MKSNPVKDFIKGVNPENASGSIEVIGNRKIVVEQTKNILEYERERVMLRTGKMTVIVNGDALSLDSYSDDVIIICGLIKNITFE